MRRLPVRLGFLCGLTACLDEDLTLGEACLADTECLGDQFCGRTDPEKALGLPGLCIEKGGTCDFGHQLGCICDPGTMAVIDDDYCEPMPLRYQTMMPTFVTCDMIDGSPTLGQCILDPEAG